MYRNFCKKPLEVGLSHRVLGFRWLFFTREVLEKKEFLPKINIGMPTKAVGFFFSGGGLKIREKNKKVMNFSKRNYSFSSNLRQQNDWP